VVSQDSSVRVVVMAPRGVVVALRGVVMAQGE
jgi:hypothetical protein